MRKWGFVAVAIAIAGCAGLSPPALADDDEPGAGAHGADRDKAVETENIFGFTAGSDTGDASGKGADTVHLLHGAGGESWSQVGSSNVYEAGIGATRKIAAGLPKNIRANCVVKSADEQIEVFELFTVTKDDDTARVVTFLLSSEAKALNGQVLYIS